MNCKALPAIAQLSAAFWYDGVYGDLIRRIDGGRWGRERAGKVVGAPHNGGYLTFTAFGGNHLVHRVCFSIAHGQWPEGQIDHIDGNRRNNRLINLRDVLPGENSQNRHNVRSDSASGLLGVRKSGDRWHSSIRVNGKPIFIGAFDTPDEARAAYLASKRDLHPFSNH